MNKPKLPTRKELDASYAKQLQVDIEEDIALSAQDALRPTISPGASDWPGKVVDELPASCPACGAGNVTGRFDIWTHMALFTPSAERPNFEHRIQCGQCGYIEHVTEEVWNAARDARLEFHNRFKRTVAKKEKRERGSE